MDFEVEKAVNGWVLSYMEYDDFLAMEERRMEVFAAGDEASMLNRITQLVEGA